MSILLLPLVQSIDRIAFDWPTKSLLELSIGSPASSDSFHEHVKIRSSEPPPNMYEGKIYFNKLRFLEVLEVLKIILAR